MWINPTSPIEMKLFTNMRLYCQFDPVIISEAMLVNAGKIVAVGSFDECRSKCEPDTEVISLNNRTVIPGFNDAHMHLLAYARSLTQVDLSSATSPAECSALIAQFIAKNALSPIEWVIAIGWNQENFASKQFLKSSDIAVPNPVIAIRTCRHVAVLSQAAADLCKDVAQISKEGAVHELDIETCAAKMPKPTGMAQLLTNAIKRLVALGITSVQANDLAAGSFDVIDAIKQAQLTVPLRIGEQCCVQTVQQLEEMKRHESDIFKVNCLKLFVDGSLGARTALLTEKYQDKDTFGKANYSYDELNKIVQEFDAAGQQVVAHAIGDAAAAMIINAFSGCHRELKHCIIHAQVLNQGLLKQIKDLGIHCIIQPTFLKSDIKIINDRIGDRTKYAYLCKSLFPKIAFSTDCPIENPDPVANMRCATQRSFDGVTYEQQEQVSIEQALWAYTEGSANVENAQLNKGKLIPKQFADFVVLVGDLTQIQIHSTWINGQIVWNSEDK